MNLRRAAREQSVLDGSIFVIPPQSEDGGPPADGRVRHWRDLLGTVRCLLARIISGDLHRTAG